MNRWGSIAVVVALVAACSPKPAVEAPGELLVVTGLAGTTEPCGCTSHPLGGIDRLAGRVEALRPAVFALVGETYYTPNAPPEQEEAKAKLITSVLEHLKPEMIVTGANDAARGKREAPPSRTIVINGVKVALAGQDKLDCSKLQFAEADIRVLLLAEDSRACEPAVDVVVVPGGETPLGPRVLGSAIWLDAGDRGRYIGHLGFHAAPGETGPWTIDDGGRAALEARAAMIKRLEGEIAALDPGPAKQVREKRLAMLQGSRVEAQKPKGRYITWSLDVIDANVAKADWAAPMVTQYNQALCDITKQATRSRTCEPAPTPADVYVGNAQCRACHPDAFSVYNQTKHARAWPTLEQASKSCDLSCIGCHSVGYGKPGGYCRLDDVEPFENVGCENCHGPGAGHIAHPADRKKWSADFRRGRNAENCMQCHNHDHSDQFDFETYLPRVLGPGHGASAQR